MTLSQICQLCTDRACKVCPISKPCGCPNRTDDTCCHAAVRRIAVQDADLDRYEMDLDMEGGEL